MSQRLSRRAARPIARQINRAPSPVIAYAAPWAFVAACSIMPTWPMIAMAPIMPPLGYMALLAWRQLRPGLLPVWAGFPLGLVDDLFSGNPFGSALVLWSNTMIVMDIIEARFPWRNFLTDWVAAAIFILVYLLCGLVLTTHHLYADDVLLIVPQMVISVMCYPIVGRVLGWLDRWRLMRFRVLG
jgi:rod shape-determining protein MreD